MSVKLNTKKKIVIKKFKNKRVEQDAKTLEYFTQTNQFDKDLSAYYNYNGLTYVLQNPSKDEDDEIHVDITSKMDVDLELKKRYFAGLNAESIAKIEEIKEEYEL